MNPCFHQEPKESGHVGQALCCTSGQMWAQLATQPCFHLTSCCTPAAQGKGELGGNTPSPCLFLQPLWSPEYNCCSFPCTLRVTRLSEVPAARVSQSVSPLLILPWDTTGLACDLAASFSRCHSSADAKPTHPHCHSFQITRVLKIYLHLKNNTRVTT